MPVALELIGRDSITYKSASKAEFNVINEVAYVRAVKELYHNLWQQRASIAALTRHHLRLGAQDTCTVLNPKEWIQGSFNVCVFVEVTSHGLSRRLVFRCPMPHKLAEARYPGTVDEKLSCEVGAYVWVQEKCPDIPVPHLLGFGFLEGGHFTHIAQRPFYVRIMHMFWRCIYSFLRYPILSHYIQSRPGDGIRSAYMLLENIGSETGEMLSATWEKHKSDPSRRQRLFVGMSRIMLSLARVPQPQIGSFRFNHDGTITLTNRPLSCSVAILENDGATRTIQKDNTYTCTEAFVSEMLTFHDHRFLSQPNAVYSADDCRGQMAVKTLLRALSHRFIRREYRNGPFVLQLTDFNASNIFVDQEWNVTCWIDLEWICALPAEMLDVPYWLTGCSIDEICDERYSEFKKVREEFMYILKEEERMAIVEHNVPISTVMQDMWESRGVWFWHCLSSVDAMYVLLELHLCPSGSLPVDIEKALSDFWCRNSDEIVQKKLADKKRYDGELKRLFGEGAAAGDV
ncbi:hypothetical protein BU26DRAFT_522282 [Trematosphaeria pertusa]|uniref:Aminoglycoside phosphotransferase domain-containing protein n=1 Tax=Trematosphaeria pertusa TaxID=390896 RepID=A0A6A6I6M0_9PLEO|nr:uncharacterized protein BU26DRAFT_522282 [Trematosphaeria pertusa]KAF2245173.1 hypothetical protein BU26DRAFT_522282 [Trematosphaeria pertusa]